MTVHRLDERTAPLETHCFVCSPTNVHGLGIAFSYDDETHEVSAEFTLDEQHSGAPTYVHGGLSLAVLNESMAWAVVATTRTFAITVDTTARFHRPLRIGVGYRVWSRVTGTESGLLHTEAAIVGDADEVCVRATATFRSLSDRISQRLRARVGGTRPTT